MKAIAMPREEFVDWPEPEEMANLNDIEAIPGLTTVYLLNEEEISQLFNTDDINEIEYRLRELHYDYMVWGERPFTNWMVIV